MQGNREDGVANWSSRGRCTAGPCRGGVCAAGSGAPGEGGGAGAQGLVGTAFPTPHVPVSPPVVLAYIMYIVYTFRTPHVACHPVSLSVSSLVPLND